MRRSVGGRALAAAALGVSLGVWLIASAGPAAAATPVQTVLPFTGLNVPSFVAVDAAGDVFVSNFAADQVLELPAGSTTQVALPFTGLDGPEGVAVDAAGDVFVANQNANQVLELPAGSTTQRVLPFTGLDSPEGVAVDAAGDVFVVNQGADQVLELPAGSTTQQVLPFTGLDVPFGIAVDAAGDVYVANTIGSQVLELPAGSTTQQVLPFTGLQAPFGIAVDAAGDVYVSDFSRARALLLPAGSTTQIPVRFTGLNEPEGVAVTPSGDDVYLGNVGTNQVLELSGLSPDGLAVTTTRLRSATGGVAYSAALKAVQGTLPYTWSVISGSLPPGLSLDATTGMISGTPTVTGTYHFTVQATDSTTPAPQTATARLSITVSGPKIATVTPDHGPSSGGTSVRIDGEHLACPAGATSCQVLVYFGTHLASVQAVKPGHITVLSPAGHGTVNVRVTRRGVGSHRSQADHFSYS